jgi:hypothetical protein
MEPISGNSAMNHQSSIDTVYKLSTHVALESFDDGALLLRLTDRHLFELNHTAQRILELTDGQRGMNEVASALAEDFQISKELALQDIISVYNELSTQGIIEIIPTG